MRPRSRRSWERSECWGRRTAAGGRAGPLMEAQCKLLQLPGFEAAVLPVHLSSPAASSPPCCLPPFCRARRLEWDSDDHVEGNYQRAGLVADANAAFGRNKRRDVLKDKVCSLLSPGSLPPPPLLPLLCRGRQHVILMNPHLAAALQAEANPEQLDAEVQDDELRAACAKVGWTAGGGDAGGTWHGPCACGGL